MADHLTKLVQVTYLAPFSRLSWMIGQTFGVHKGAYSRWR